MPTPSNAKADPDANLKQDFVAQVVVGAAAAGSTALLLIQVLPQLLRGFP